MEAALKRNPKARNYRVTAKNNQIIIHEAVGGGAGEFAEMLSGMGFGSARSIQDRMQDIVERHTSYSPVMRFILDDPETRSFHAERWCYLGSIDNWIRVGQSGKVDELAKKLTPKLGTEEFFDIY